MEKPRYQLGDLAWKASFEGVENWVTCTDCGGTRRVRVLMADDALCSVECGACRFGWEGSQGALRVYDRVPKTYQIEIIGVTIRDDGIEYQGREITEGPARTWFVKEVECFGSFDLAHAAALQMAADADAEEREKINRKVKDKKSWAWNASYHRKEIKEAERRLEYHRAALNVAVQKSRIEKAEAARP